MVPTPSRVYVARKDSRRLAAQVSNRLLARASVADGVGGVEIDPLAQALPLPVSRTRLIAVSVGGRPGLVYDVMGAWGSDNARHLRLVARQRFRGATGNFSRTSLCHLGSGCRRVRCPLNCELDNSGCPRRSLLHGLGYWCSCDSAGNALSRLTDWLLCARDPPTGLIAGALRSVQIPAHKAKCDS